MQKRLVFILSLFLFSYSYYGKEAKSNPKVLIVVPENYEEIELTTVYDVLIRAHVEVTLASLTKDLIVKGDNNLSIKTDVQLDEVETKNYSALFLPGGTGAQNYSKYQNLYFLIQDFVKENKKIAAICLAPLALAQMGFMDNKAMTVNPAVKDQLPQSVRYNERQTTVDGNIITGFGPGNSSDFAFVFLKELLGEKKAQEVKNMLLFQ